jgi:acetyl esterase/lipase
MFTRQESACALGLAAVLATPTAASWVRQDAEPTAPPMEAVQEPPPPSAPPQRPQPQGGGQGGALLRLPPDVEAVRDVVYATATNDDGSTHDLLMDTFFPKVSGDEPLPAIVYIHGGGWSQGSKEIGGPYSAMLASGGYFSASINYRLVQHARFPACMNDVKAAIRFLRANAEELGIDPDRIGVWGHSAGGHLSAYLGTTGNAPETHGDVGEHDDTAAHVACVVDFFGPADLSTLFNRRGRGGGGIDRVRRGLFGDGERNLIAETLRTSSPQAYVDSADPPFLIIHGTEDDLVPIDQSRAFHAALRAAGVTSELVEVEGAGHGIRDPEVLLKTAAFFDAHLGGDATGAMERLREGLQQAGDRLRDAARREFSAPPRDRRPAAPPDDDGGNVRDAPANNTSDGAGGG